MTRPFGNAKYQTLLNSHFKLSFSSSQAIILASIAFSLFQIESGSLENLGKLGNSQAVYIQHSVSASSCTGGFLLQETK